MLANAFLLKNSERIHMFEEASRFAASTNRPLDIYAHVGALSTDEAIEMARAAKSAGIKHIAQPHLSISVYLEKKWHITIMI